MQSFKMLYNLIMYYIEIIGNPKTNNKYREITEFTSAPISSFNLFTKDVGIVEQVKLVRFQPFSNEDDYSTHVRRRDDIVK